MCEGGTPGRIVTQVVFLPQTPSRKMSGNLDKARMSKLADFKIRSSEFKAWEKAKLKIRLQRNCLTEALDEMDNCCSARWAFPINAKMLRGVVYKMLQEAFWTRTGSVETSTDYRAVNLLS
nr:uncharacterized protein LOC128695399 isoform X2 [Cherax quadricarinatus]